MTLNLREFRTVLHGMVFGAIYLIAFAGGFAGLWSLRKEFITVEESRFSHSSSSYWAGP